MPREGYKVAVIGGGSSYTPELIEGLAARRDVLPLREVALVDVPEGRDKVEAVAGLARRMLERTSVPAEVTVTFDRRRAIEGADFVINQFRVGGLKARAVDERIPLAYGVVGQETTGPGGFAKALRTIPVVLAVARDVRELAPEAWMLNFTNPAGMVTEAVLKHVAGVKCLGLCNVPVAIQRAVAGQLEVEPWRVEIDLVGLNHLGWISAVRLDGEDILPRILALPVVEAEFVRNIPGADGIRPLLDALGMLPSPYLQYYYFHDRLLAREKEEVASGKGTRAEQVMAVEKEIFQRYRDPDLAEKPPELEKRGGAYYSEAALEVMVSLTGRGDGPVPADAGPAPAPAGSHDRRDPRDRHIVNVVNRLDDAPEGRVLPDLPSDVVVETACFIGPGGARPERGTPLPLSVRGLVQAVKAYEELAIEAAVTGERRKAFLALLAHPLVPGAETAQGLLADILEANRDHLPQFYRS